MPEDEQNGEKGFLILPVPAWRPEGMWFQSEELHLPEGESPRTRGMGLGGTRGSKGPRAGRTLSESSSGSSWQQRRQRKDLGSRPKVCLVVTK